MGAGLQTGIGTISGTECVIVANDPTVKGGAQGPSSVRKGLRAMDIARQNRLPLISLTESAGADLPQQAEIFVPGGASFKNLTQLSAAGILTVTMVFGSSTAGGAYVPGMSDYVVLQKEAAKVYLGGPPLVKMAIDEDADEEELGGAEMHTRGSPGRRLLGAGRARCPADRPGDREHLRWRKQGTRSGPAPVAPRYDPEELLGIASADVRVPFDVHDVLAWVLDDSASRSSNRCTERRWSPVGPHQRLPGGRARQQRHPVQRGVAQGCAVHSDVQPDGRADHLCAEHHRIHGGTRYEQGGIIKDGAKPINAVSNSTVPHITLMVGASYGAGNYGMSGRARPRFVFTWPNHRIAVMGPKQLAGVLTIVAKQKAGDAFDEAAFAPIRDAFEKQVEDQSTALFATGRLWDDGIIDPRDTRTVLGWRCPRRTPAPVAGTSNYGIWRM